MSAMRPVFLHDGALVCSRGLTPAATAEALWRGDAASTQCRVGQQSFPFQALPLPEAGWWEHAQTAFRHLAGQLPDLPDDLPLFLASSSFDIGGIEAGGAPFSLPAGSAAFACQIGEWLGLSGPRSSYANACISGFSALDAAATLIANGLIDDALVLGFELANRTTMAGFASMELLSRDASRPLDRDRDGLVLGEGIAAIRLSATPSEWRLAGLRTGLDTHTPTGPDPSGGPIAALLAETLAAAGMSSGDIDLVKLQAAGSPVSDLAEAMALMQVFGQTLPPLLSLKPALGHTLGASGIVELVALLACLKHDQIPETSGFRHADTQFSTVFPVHRSTRPIRRPMLNLIGFGGGLASMILEREA